MQSAAAKPFAHPHTITDAYAVAHADCDPFFHPFDYAELHASTYAERDPAPDVNRDRRGPRHDRC